MPTYSRRSVLFGFGAAVGLASLPRHAFAALDGTPFTFLTDSEARSLALLCDTLIPQDDFPSASQAGVVDFIDLQLAGGYGRGEHLYMDGPHPQGTPEQGYQSPLRPAELWREGLAAMQTVIGPLEGQPQSALDQLMTDLSEDRPALAGRVGAKTFFTELHALTNQGYFADPIYGGNKGYAGWHMVGFPGAFGYFSDTVDAHNRPYRQPPMGIGHQPGTSDFNWER